WKRVEKAIELDRNLREFAAAGLSAVYHTCDVSDRAALSKVLDQVRAADGPIEGIVHGAGVESASAFPKKKPEVVEPTFDVKVGGAANLMALTRNDPVRFFVGFGSTSGRFGGTGQADYSAANEMLAKLVSWYRRERPECRALTFHWHGWDEIGMAARPEARSAPALRGMRYMPPREGVTYLVEELLAGAPECEILVTDHRLCVQVYPEMAHPRPEVPPPLRVPVAPADQERQASSPSVARARAEEGTNQVARRYVPRLEEAPVPDGALRLSGPALILGDGPEAQALHAHIVRQGRPVHRLPSGDDPRAAVAELERLWAIEPAPHLFLLTAREREAAGTDLVATCRQRRQRGLLVPFAVCKRWSELIAASPPPSEPTLVAVTALGGDFGFGQVPAAPEGGFLAGLLKSFHQETLGKSAVGVRVKVLDAPLDELPEETAAACLRELASGDDEIEVAWRKGKRYRIALVPQPAAELPRRDLPHGGVWVVTGGARGITAAIALELGRRMGLKLHLLGRSGLPTVDPSYRDLAPDELQQLRKRLFQQARLEGRRFDWDSLYRQIEMDRSLRAFAAAGVQATYHRCDVTDRAQLAETLQRIRRADGPITGVLHGAGIPGAIVRLGEMTSENVSAVLQTKVDAMLDLIELTRDDPLDAFLGFGSITGRFGSAGRTDYASACELQAKVLDVLRSRRPACRITTIHWHPWAEVGMMMSTRAAGVGPGVPLMPKAEGVGHLVDELQAGAPEPEVVVVDLPWHRSVVERLRAAAASKPRPAAQGSAGRSAAGQAAGTPPDCGDYPLIDRVEELVVGKRVVAELELKPASDPFLVQHRFRGKPLLPIVMAAEAFAEAAALASGGKPVAAIREVDVAEAVRCFSEQPVPVRIIGEATGTSIACRLTKDFVNRAGKPVEKDRVHLAGTVDLGDGRPLAAPPLPRRPEAWYTVEYPEHIVIYHGPVLRRLKLTSVLDEEGWGWIVSAPWQDLVAGRRGKGLLV
ncbi:MAG: SDR family NAD(P)-dependent oxidoreductase, partial [Thermoguttaceae bacterium]|nr:SDR family NAD(P)-dependent oxidoreductase [Thermoguttaceae bacterium]